MNIRSASVLVNYEQTSATLIETNSLSRSRGEGQARGGGGTINFRKRSEKFLLVSFDESFAKHRVIFFLFFFLWCTREFIIVFALCMLYYE